MAEVKISALTNVSSLDGTEEFAVVQGGVTKAAAITDVVPIGRTAAEITAGVTPVNYEFPTGHLYRYATNTTPGTTDMTTALQAACDSYREVFLPPEQSLITSTITQTVNRQTIHGLGIQSEIVWNPPANDDILFTGSNLDNMVYRAFSINGNVGSATGKIGIQFGSDTSRILVDEVYFDTVDKNCIKRDSLQYDQYLNCRFLSTGNGTDDNGIAILVTTFANRIKIDGCRFGNNDRDINIAGGKGVSITDNSFETTGSLMGNVANWDTSIELTDCEGFTIDANYFEAVRTLTTTGVVRLKSSSAVTTGSVDNNFFSADLGGTSYSKNIVYVGSGHDVRVSVSYNAMMDGTNAINAFIVGGDRKIIAHGNYYEESGSELTTYAAIILRISNADLIDIDIGERDTSEVVTTTNVITQEESGKTFYLNAAGGFTSTLPSPALGLNYTFIVSTAPTTAYIVTTTSGANILYGTLLDIVGEQVAITAQDTINFVASTSLVGDSLKVEADATNWYCNAKSLADGGITIAVT